MGDLILKKLTSGQTFNVQLVLRADGTDITAGSPVAQVKKDGGSYSGIAGSITHDADGSWELSPTAADVNFDRGSFKVTVTDGLTVTMNVVTDPSVNMTQLGDSEQSATDLKDFADAGYDPATNKVEGVKLADTTTTNTDMRGTDGANTVTPPTAGQNADAVWDELQSGHTTAGTFGFNLDVPVSSVSGGGGLTEQNVRDAMKLPPTSGAPGAGSIDEHLDSLDVTKLTTARAGNLDNLDATISSRQPIGPVDLNADQSGATVGTVSGSVGSVAAPVNANVTNWQGVPIVYGDSAYLGALTVTTNNDKTGYSLTANQSAVTVGTVNTCVSNTDMRGTDNALPAAAAPTNFEDLAITNTTGYVTVGINQDKTGYSGTVTSGTVDSVTGNVGGNVVGSVGSVVAPVTAGTVSDKTGYSIAGTKTTLDALNDIAAADVLAAGDIDGYSLEDAQKIQLSSAGGVLSGAATEEIVIQAADASKARITAQVDESGNRTSVVLDGVG